MAKINTLNYQTVASWNGSQDLFIVEQPDGTKVATPEQLKQYVLNDMDNVPTQNSNNPVKSGGIYSTMAVPKYDAANRREYYEGGSAFSGNIDSAPTAGSNNAVASGGTKTYVDNAVSQLNDEIGNLIKFKDVTVNASTSGYAAPSSTAGGVWIEALASYEALGVSREKIIGIIPVDWSSITQPLSIYLGSTSVRVMLHSSSSIYSNSSVSYVKLRVVYHS